VKKDMDTTDSLIEQKQPNKKSIFKGIFEYVETFCYALVIMILLFMFIFRNVSVDGDSMNKTLNDKDRLIISNLAYTPKTGDIVVLRFPGEPLIKRVIAVGGQKVKIDYESWAVYVDGKKLDEKYMNYVGGAMMTFGGPTGEFFVDKDKVFVMGDNRNNSRDSREFGQFSEDDILGRVIFRVYPNFGDPDKKYENVTLNIPNVNNGR
jgi:signal peptidase I